MVIVGLGNPGKKYEKTYHNVGFMTVDLLAESLGVEFKVKECDSVTASLYVRGEKIILAKPQTFMNLSGLAVKQLRKRYSDSDEDIIVILDDIDIPPGTIRFRKSGSGGTHNGMRNIVENVGGGIPRIRIGIGKPLPPVTLIDYVLMNIGGENAEKIMDASKYVSGTLMEFIASDSGNLDRLGESMNRKR